MARLRKQRGLTLDPLGELLGQSRQHLITSDEGLARPTPVNRRRYRLETMRDDSSPSTRNASTSSSRAVEQCRAPGQGASRAAPEPGMLEG